MSPIFARTIGALAIVFLCCESGRAQGEILGLTTCCPTELRTVSLGSGVTDSIGELGDVGTVFLSPGVTVDPVFRVLHALRAETGGTIRVISVDLATGDLVEGSPLSEPLLQLAYDFESGQLLGLTNCCPSEVAFVDAATGVVTPIATVAAAGQSLVATPPALMPADHTIYFIRNDVVLGDQRLVAVDLLTDVVTVSPSLTLSLLRIGVNDVTGELFGITECCPHQFVSVDFATATATPLSDLGDATFTFGDVAAPVDSDTQRFYAIRSDGTDQSVLIIDTITGGFVAGGAVDSELFNAISVREGGLTFSRGDANGDGGTDLSDAVFSLAALFVAMSAAPECEDSADANDDGAFDVSDPVYILAVLFIPMTVPFPEPTVCGVDDTVDTLLCDTFGGCP